MTIFKTAPFNFYSKEQSPKFSQLPCRRTPQPCFSLRLLMSSKSEV